MPIMDKHNKAIVKENVHKKYSSGWMTALKNLIPADKWFC